MDGLLRRLLIDQRHVEVENAVESADVDMTGEGATRTAEDEEVEAKVMDELVQVINQTAGVTALVEQLGPFLTSDDPIPRVKATAVLCEILRRLEDDPSRLSAAQVKTLLQFFLNRYQTDWESALACLKGIQSLLQRNSFSSHAVFDKTFTRELLSFILTSHTVNDLSQPLRALVFDITRMTLNKFGEFISQTEEDPWLSTVYAGAMAGEKDPRCLLLCLDTLRILLKSPQFGGDAFVEDAFEVTSVYFPITFRPPPNDPFGITHEELVNILNAVFCSTPRMVHCVLPMTVERLKMTSTEAGPARIEALRLIACCARAFDAVTMSPFLGELRDNLVGLILSPDEDELATEALNTLKTLVRLVAPRAQVNPQDALWDEFTLVTLRRCGMALEASIDSMAASGAARILVAISESCSIGFSTALKGLVPLLENFFKAINTAGGGDAADKLISRKLAAMDLVRNLGRCVDPGVGHLPGEGPMDLYAPRLFALVLGELENLVESKDAWITSSEESKYVVACTLALKDLVCRPSGLSVALDEVVNRASLLLVNHIVLPIIRSKNRSMRKDVLGAALICLKDFDAKCKTSQLLVSSVIPVLLDEAKATATSEHFDIVGGEMKDKLETILLSLPLLCQSTEDETIPRSIVTFLADENAAIPPEMVQPILPKIAKSIPKVETMEKCFLGSADLFGLWMSSPANAQLLSILTERSSPVTNAKLVKIAIEAFQLSQKLEPGCEACLLAMRRDYAFVLPALLNILDDHKDLVDEESFLRVLACAINKAPAGDVLQSSVERLFQMVDQFSPAKAAKLFGRAFKALTLRSSSQQADKMGKFLQSLLHSEDQEVSLEASKAFGNLVLLHDLHDGLDVPFARAQGVARQRAFEKWFKLLHEDLTTSEKSGDALLSACAALAAGAPCSVLVESLKDVIPVMVRASKASNEATRLSALRILKAVIKEESKTVDVHLSTLIPFLLRFTAGAQRAPHPTDRLDALEVLESLPELMPYHKLHSYRGAVSSALASGALDDPKRVVRQKAVVCREKWALFASS